MSAHPLAHVEHESLAKVTDGIDVLTMWCGEQCLCMPDASLIPDGFDFYGERHAHKSDCGPCKRALSDAQLSTTIEAVEL